MRHQTYVSIFGRNRCGHRKSGNAVPFLIDRSSSDAAASIQFDRAADWHYGLAAAEPTRTATAVTLSRAVRRKAAMIKRSASA